MFRRSVLIVRWALVASYIALVTAGFLDVTPFALAVSGGILIAYNIAHTLLELHENARNSNITLVATRHLDVFMVTVALVALHDAGNPVWAIYLINIVGVAHFVNRREMLALVLWVAANYIAVAAIVNANGYDVSWPYVTVIEILVFTMGINAVTLAGGEQRLRDLITAAAVTDQLTGLPNRRRFHAVYPQSLQQAVSSNVPLALMLIDVDHFKEINDQQGHPAGDDKLCEVADALRSVVRGNDLVARYGGDEFIVVAPHTSREDAVVLAERLRSAAHAVDATVSIGVAIFPEDADHEDRLIEIADSALYLAKQAGRNCVRTPVAA